MSQISLFEDNDNFGKLWEISYSYGRKDGPKYKFQISVIELFPISKEELIKNFFNQKYGLHCKIWIYEILLIIKIKEFIYE